MTGINVQLTTTITATTVTTTALTSHHSFSAVIVATATITTTTIATTTTIITIEVVFLKGRYTNSRMNESQAATIMSLPFYRPTAFIYSTISVTYQIALVPYCCKSDPAVSLDDISLFSRLQCTPVPLTYIHFVCSRYISVNCRRSEWHIYVRIDEFRLQISSIIFP